MIDATPLFRLYARWRRRALEAPAAETQKAQLLHLVRRAEGTRFGRDHGFSEIATVDAFQSRVPLRRYEDFWEEYWRKAFPDFGGITWPGRYPYLALSSGTSTGRTKYIPVSHEMLRSNRKAAIDVIVHHLVNRPESRVMGGPQFMLGGTIELERLAPGILAGDLTAIATQDAPRWFRSLAFLPGEIARETDWQTKIDRLAAVAPGRNIRNIAGTASWLLMFFERLAELHSDERRLARYFPGIELVVHGGVSFEPYRERFESWLENSHAELREVYPASEGFIAAADRGSGEGLRLNLDHGLFFEFVPVEELDADAPTRHWVGNAETGTDYAVIVSTCAGMWAHVVGDTVRFVDLDPPRVLVTGRTSYYLSAFGEHLSGEEIEDAVLHAVRNAGAGLSEFAVGTRLEESGRGNHVFVIEPVLAGNDLRPAAGEVAAAVDARLHELNDDYGAHRAGDFGMGEPQVLLVRRGTFEAWMRERGKLGGQNKVPRVVNDAALFETLRLHAEQHLLPPPR